MAEWLCSGLQSRVRRFDSDPRLQNHFAIFHACSFLSYDRSHESYEGGRGIPAVPGLDNAVLIRLDALRKQRNLTEYTGDTIPEAALDECLRQAEFLQALAIKWLKANRPELV